MKPQVNQIKYDYKSQTKRLYNGEKIETGLERGAIGDGGGGWGWGGLKENRTKETREEGVSMCKWEGVGISRGRVQQRNEREGWHSSGLIQGPLWQCGEPHTMHGYAIATETPPSTTAMECKGRGREKEDREKAEPEKAIFNSWVSQNCVTLNRPGLYSNHNESCLERVCCLLVVCLSGVCCM